MPDKPTTVRDAAARTVVAAFDQDDGGPWGTATPCGWTAEGTMREVVARYNNHVRICEACQDAGMPTP